MTDHEPNDPNMSQLEHEHVYDQWFIPAGASTVTLICSCGAFLTPEEIIRRVNGYEPMERENARLRKIEESAREMISIRHVCCGVSMCPVSTGMMDALDHAGQIDFLEDMT